MKTRIMLIASVASLIACAAFAATSSPRRSVRRPSAKSAPVCTVNPVVDYSRRIKVDPAGRHEGLLLFAVSVPGVKVPNLGLTLDQAMKQGLVEISELREADVNRLRVRNRSKEPVFVMAGEMLRGGKQDRIAGDDLILPPKSDLTIPVFCVEHGRWAGRESGFSAGHSLAGAKVRGAAARSGARGGGQGAVWEGVAEQQRALGAPSATGALRSVHDSEAVRDHMKPYLSAFSDLPSKHPKAVGVVAVAGDEILAADLFSAHKLFVSMWPDLLEAYVVDALERDGGGVREPRRMHDAGFTNPALGGKGVLRWLGGLHSARMSPKDTPGDGELYDLSARNISGTALLYDCSVVHLALFPGEIAVAEPAFNTLQFRRDRLQ